MFLLYPNDRLETLSLSRDDVDANELLSGWSALFHPALLEYAKTMPRWESASTPPYYATNTTKTVFVIPQSSRPYLPDQWEEEQLVPEKNEGVLLVTDCSGRKKIVETILAALHLTEHGFDDSFIADCLALGTAYYLTDMMVRKTQYSSLLDDSRLLQYLLDAIQEYRAGNKEKCDEKLERAFETICQSKEYCYPSQMSFIDFVLVTPETTGKPLQDLLRDENQINLFLSSQLLAMLPEHEPETLSALQSAVAENRVDCVVDDTETKSLRLLPPYEIIGRIKDGLDCYKKQLGVTPSVFGKLHTGLTPTLPQILKLVGLKNIVHFAPLDGWHIKEQGQSVVRWKGADGSPMDALVRYPIQADLPSVYFDLPSRIGDALNVDHTPTIVFARFPGQKTVWLDDLKRIDRITSPLGKFYGISAFFENHSYSGTDKTFGFGSYPSSVFQKFDTDPVSHYFRLYRNDHRRLLRESFRILCGSLEKRIEPRDHDNDETKKYHERFVELIRRNVAPTEPGLFFVNPYSFSRQIYCNISDWPALPKKNETVLLAKETNDRKEMLVELPPLGFAFVPKPAEEKKAASSAKKPKKTGLFRWFVPTPIESPLVRRIEETLNENLKRKAVLLQNEFFEAKFDTVTGMLRSVFTPGNRYNRLSQQLAFRFPKEARSKDTRDTNDMNFGYSIPVADSVTVVQSGPITGCLKVKGRLVAPSGEILAAFTMAWQIRRQSRVLECSVKIEPNVELTEPQWDSYFGLRFAWSDNSLELRGGINHAAYPISMDRIQAPLFVDLRGEQQSLTFLTPGLPFHRRFDERKLDTLLVVKGESAREFRFGIGVDIKNPTISAISFLADEYDFKPTADMGSPSSSWLFYIEAKSVIALTWEPVVDSETGGITAIRTILQETEGHRIRFSLRSFLPIIKAAATDLFGAEIKDLTVKEDGVVIEMHEYEMLPLTLLIKPQT